MKYFSSLLLSVIAFSVLAQDITIELGPGIGRSFSREIMNKREGRFGFIIGSNIFLSDRFSIGTQVVWTGRITTPGSVFESFDETTGITTLDASSNKLRSLLFSTKYYFSTQMKLRFFSGMGAGLNTFLYKQGTEDGSKVLVKKSSFAIAPEIGVAIGKNISMSVHYLISGKTPQFNGPDLSERLVKLNSVNANSVMLTFKYQFYLHKGISATE